MPRLGQLFAKIWDGSAQLMFVPLFFLLLAIAAVLELGLKVAALVSHASERRSSLRPTLSTKQGDRR